MRLHPLQTPVRVGFVILFLCLPLLEGCSYYLSARRTTKKLAREVVTQDGDYRKTIAVARFDNRSYYTWESVELIFQQKLIEILKSACPDLLLFKPGDPDYPKLLEELPRQASGKIDNLRLAMAARPFGLDAVATGSVIDIAAYEEKRGIFWLRDTVSFIQIQIDVEVFDTETGAKLLDENFIREVRVDEADHDLVKQKKQISIAEIPETLQYIATLLGEQICDALSGQRWKSYIVSKDGQRVTISAGQKAGLKQGMQLEVFESSKIIKGLDDERFFLPGKKTGEIRITNAHPDKSEAEITTDNGIQVGSAVKLK